MTTTTKTQNNQSQCSSLTAILVGFSVGNGVSYFFLYVFATAFLWVLAAQGVPSQELYSRAYQSTAYLIFAQSVALLTIIPGGYWCARLSPRNAMVNALLAGLLLSLFAFAQLLIPYEVPNPTWSRIASVVIPVPAFLLGALWWRKYVV
jgi:hypothetical protein